MSAARGVARDFGEHSFDMKRLWGRNVGNGFGKNNHEGFLVAHVGRVFGTELGKSFGEQILETHSRKAFGEHILERIPGSKCWEELGNLFFPQQIPQANFPRTRALSGIHGTSTGTHHERGGCAVC